MNIDEQCVKLCRPIKSQVRFYFFELSAFEEGILFTQQDLCLLHIRILPSKAQAVAAAVNRPLPHYKLGDLGIVPRSHPKLGERPGASSPLAPISRQTRSVGVQTVSAQKVSAFITILPMIISYKLSTRFLNSQTP